jgi:hypothetical protein
MLARSHPAKYYSFFVLQDNPSPYVNTVGTPTALALEDRLVMLRSLISVGRLTLDLTGLFFYVTGDDDTDS